jgi:hypothetical protein
MEPMTLPATFLILENNDMQYVPEDEIYQTLDRFTINVGELVDALCMNMEEVAPKGLYTNASLEPVATASSVLFFKKHLPKNPKIREVYHIPRYEDVLKVDPVDVFLYTGNEGLFSVAKRELLGQFVIRTKDSPERLIIPEVWMRKPERYLGVDKPLIPYAANKAIPDIVRRLLLGSCLSIPNGNYSSISAEGAQLDYLEYVFSSGEKIPAISDGLERLLEHLKIKVGRYTNHIHKVSYDPFTRIVTVERGIDHFAYLYHVQEMLDAINRDE